MREALLAATRRRQLAAAVVGAVATLTSIALLFLWEIDGRGPLGQLVGDYAAGLADVVSLDDLSDSLYYDWKVWEIAALILLLIVIPVLRLSRRHRVLAANLPAGAATDDSSLVGGTDIPVANLERSTGELRDLASNASIPWTDLYATPGGARVLIALAHRRDQVPEPEPSDPVPLPVPALDRDPAPLDPPDEPPVAPEPLTYGNLGDVYTSTTLYQSSTSRDEPTDPSTEEETR